VRNSSTLIYNALWRGKDEILTLELYITENCVALPRGPVSPLIVNRLNWRPRRFKWTRPFFLKDEILFLHVCHHISNARACVCVCGYSSAAVHFQLQILYSNKNENKDGGHSRYRRLSRVSTNSEVKSNVLVCEMCKEYEFQLNETLDELNSIIMINKLLQKELLLHTPSKTVWENNLGKNENTDSIKDNVVSNWMQIVTKSKKDKWIPTNR
jgi:hypothetical protein